MVMQITGLSLVVDERDDDRERRIAYFESRPASLSSEILIL
jgi:hypothetical protein